VSNDPESGLSHARVRVCGQETWYHNVTKVTADHGYLRLHLAAHPSLVHVWLDGHGTSVLLAAAGDDVTALLREEQKPDLSAAADMDKRFGPLFSELEPAWAAITIRMLSETDGETVHNFLHRLKDWTVQIKLKDQAPLDGVILNTAYDDPSPTPDSCRWGIAFAPTDESGKPIPGAELTFARYEDIESIGIY
jgi:hypothetical protein